MIISAVTELVSGARFFVGTESGVKIVYHAAGVDPVFTDAPVITRADGMISFDTDAGTKARCSIVNTPDNDYSDIVNFISVETVVV